jgi:hypothetical protein
MYVGELGIVFIVLRVIFATKYVITCPYYTILQKISLLSIKHINLSNKEIRVALIKHSKQKRNFKMFCKI